MCTSVHLQIATDHSEQQLCPTDVHHRLSVGERLHDDQLRLVSKHLTHQIREKTATKNFFLISAGELAVIKKISGFFW